MVGDEVALPEMSAGVPVSGSSNATRATGASVALSSASRYPRPAALLTATYSVAPSIDSAGALFIATRSMPGSSASRLAACHVPLPSAASRATPLLKAAGLAPVTKKPNQALPTASTVIGVLTMTVLFSSACAAA